MSAMRGFNHVSDTDHTGQLAPINDWQVPVARRGHLPHQPRDVILRNAGGNIARHHLGDPHGQQCGAVLIQSTDDVALGQRANERSLPQPVNYNQGTDLWGPSSRPNALAMLASARWSGQIEPTTPEPATLTQIANHITEIITSGTHNQTKALVEALVAKVTTTAPDRLIPIFRIPQPNHHHKPATTDPPGKTTPTAAVRTMTKSVGRVGLEPTT
jgi:hypothetical protein